jgi:hypothetical protein
VEFAGGKCGGVEWIKVTLLSKVINPRLPQVAGNILIIRVFDFTWLHSFCTYKHRNLVVHEKMHVLIKIFPLFFNSVILFSNNGIRCIESLYSLTAEVSQIIIYQNR